MKRQFYFRVIGVLYVQTVLRYAVCHAYISVFFEDKKYKTGGILQKVTAD